MEEFLKIFGSINISTVVVFLTAVVFGSKMLYQGYVGLMEMHDRKQESAAEMEKMCDLKHQVEKIGNGVVALLHFRLYAECGRIIETGHCSVEEWEDLTHLYQSYIALGGNGTGTLLYEKAALVFKKSKAHNIIK